MRNGDPYMNHMEVRMIPPYSTDVESYYTYDNALYTRSFPVEWATDHEYGTGPNDCVHCATDGSWNGVFIGYCTECSQTLYQGTRGRGFISPGVENCSEQVIDFPSVFDTYLMDILLEQVGDPGLFNSQQAIDIDELTQITMSAYQDENDYDPILFGVRDKEDYVMLR
jgi:hypothetical protein|tara:strand:+ start:3711 stop:4214 length:504 start_codon:yes stop_codon:yes gene_type:complete